MVEILDIEGYTFDKEALRLALDEYERVKSSKDYNEKYKWETFEELNDWFDRNEINEDNVVEFVEFIQEQNQGSGYFVHWSELDDLREYAGENPEKLTELFDNLYYGEENLEDRLADFREETGVGTPGLGYLLAAYDFKEFAPIKVDEFRYFFEDFADQMPSRITKLSIPEKYSLFYQYCHSMADFLEEEGVVEEATPLDAQDFYYTIEAYDEVSKEKIFFEYIWQFCQRFEEFEKDSKLLIEEINSLPIDFLKSERDSYENSEKVNKIRYLTLDKLIEDGNVDIEKIETEVNSEYEKNILQAWTSFTIHSQIYWDYFSDRLNKYFESICEFLINNIEVEGLEYNLVTFQGSRGRPTVKPYVLIYPEEKGDHRDSYQFFLRILPEKIQYGLSHGENIEDSDFKEKYVGEITDIDENSLEQIVERYNQFSDEFRKLNNLSMDMDEDIKWYIDKYKELHDYQSELEKRKEFKRKYRKIFDPDNLDELEKEDVFSFLRDSFWPGLHRSKKKLTEDMDKFRKSIEYLLDEDEDIKERLNNVVDDSDSEYWIRGMGKNLASAIISTMDDSDEYGILNERAVGAMKKLGIYPEEINTTMSTGEKYVKINEVLKQLNDLGLENMWEVDYFVYWLDENYEKLKEEKRSTDEREQLSLELPNEVDDIFREVFTDDTLINSALEHFDFVFDAIRGEEGLEDSVAVTWRKKDRMISVNIGNWKIFRIAREEEDYQCAIAVDLDIIPENYESWSEHVENYRKFDLGENHKLIKFEWRPNIFENHPDLREAMKKATTYAFEHFDSSAYTNSQHEGLFKFFTDKEYHPSGTEEIPTEEEEGTNYFWITANPSRWEVSEIEDGGEVFYTAYNSKGNKRRIFDAFQKAKPGDEVLFYQSTPVKKIVAEGVIKQGLHISEEEEYDEPREGISIEYKQPIRRISWNKINSVPDLENSHPVSNRAQGSIFELTKDEYETILALELEEPVTEKTGKELLLEKNKPDLDFDLDEEDITDGLHFPPEIRDDIQSSIISALKSGKHIILTGPPGTGKTKLAENVAEAMKENCDCIDDYIFTTATADWTTFDTMGGYQPSKEDGSLEFNPGQFLKCFKEDGKPMNNWLIIDEINRADIDKAFGQLFSVLSKDEVELPFTDDEGKSISVEPLDDEIDDDFDYSDSDYYVTSNWRLLATMNTFDKASLYEMSYAFMRRFAFIDVGVPTEEFEENDELINDYIGEWDDIEVDDFSNEKLTDLTKVWKVLNKGKRSIGPAIIKDMLMFLNEYDGEDGLVNALKLYVLPQLEGMVKQNQKKIFEDLEGEIGYREELEKVAKERFEIEIEWDENE